MTPAIQTSTMPSAEEHSLNLTRVFKKMLPFPENLPMPALIFGIDLGSRSWQVCVQSSRKSSRHVVRGENKRGQFMELVARELARHQMASRGDCVVCYEIGRDGVWLRDWLVMNGLPCVVFTADVLCGGGRDVKTDRVDAKRLAERLAHFFRGELEYDHIYMPPPREFREEYVAQRTAAGNRFKSILALHGEVPGNLHVGRVPVESLVDAQGRPLPTHVASHLRIEQEIWQKYNAEIKRIDGLLKSEYAAIRQAAAAGGCLTRRQEMTRRLMEFKGIGLHVCQVLVGELFSKEFRNTGQVSSATGLVDTPHASGTQAKSRGISRRSPHQLRATLVELAWLWVRHQPDSALVRWYTGRTSEGVAMKRMKKVAIVAVARKLAVALWKNITSDIEIEGAVPKEADRKKKKKAA